MLQVQAQQDVHVLRFILHEANRKTLSELQLDGQYQALNNAEKLSVKFNFHARTAIDSLIEEAAGIRFYFSSPVQTQAYHEELEMQRVVDLNLKSEVLVSFESDQLVVRSDFVLDPADLKRDPVVDFCYEILSNQLENWTALWQENFLHLLGEITLAFNPQTKNDAPQ